MILLTSRGLIFYKYPNKKKLIKKVMLPKDKKGGRKLKVEIFEHMFKAQLQ